MMYSLNLKQASPIPNLDSLAKGQRLSHRIDELIALLDMAADDVMYGILAMDLAVSLRAANQQLLASFSDDVYERASG